jgi:hypothetical protein
MTTALGIDPGSTYTGLAVVRASAATRLPVLLHLAAVRMGADPLQDLRRAFAAAPMEDVDRIVVERAPKTARKDTGRQGVQGMIGWSQGYIAGLATMAAWAATGDNRGPSSPGPAYSYAEPSAWRPVMLAASARAGKLLQEPRRSAGDHDDVRNAWKAAACAFVAHAYPEPYAALVADARSRARTAKHDWELMGVPDACEAVGIALHGLVDRAQPTGLQKAVDAAKATQRKRAATRRGR